MKLSINKKIINKNETKERSQAKGFDPVDVTPDEFAAYIARKVEKKVRHHKAGRGVED